MTKNGERMLRNRPTHIRLIQHASFWMAYYVLFSLIWASPPEKSYYASFYLEFVLMPLRILASYCMIYLLIPNFLSNRKSVSFFSSYVLLIAVAGGLQMLIGHFFYDSLLGEGSERFSFSPASWARNIVLINSTVLFLGAVKVFQLHFQLVDSLSEEQASTSHNTPALSTDFIEVKSNKQTHRLRIDSIEYVESMGNYIRYVTKGGQRTVVYSSLKAAEQALPDCFIRIHRSYLINRSHIKAYDKESVTVGEKIIPRAQGVNDAMLR